MKKMILGACAALCCGLALNGWAAANEETGMAELSQQTGVPVATLKDEQTRTGLNSSDLLTAHTLATKTGKSFDDLATEHASGASWNKIAKENHVNLNQALAQVNRNDESSEKSHTSPSNKSHTPSTSAHTTTTVPFNPPAGTSGSGVHGRH